MRTTTRCYWILAGLTLFVWAWLSRWDAPSPEKIVSSRSAPLATRSTPVPALAEAPRYEEEFIHPPGLAPAVHAASLCEMPDGKLASVWYGGSREGASDVAIFFSTKPPREKAEWSAPRRIVDRDSATRELGRYVRKLGNPLLFADAKGRLRLVFVSVSLGGWAGSSLNVKTSADGGQHWSPACRLTLSPFLNLSELVRNKPFLVNERGAAIPIYHEFLGKFPEVLWLGEPQGNQEWWWAKTRICGGRTFLQPSVVLTETGRAYAWLRHGGDEHQLAWCHSEDGGLTWSRPGLSSLPNPDAGIDTLALPDGRWLLVFNDSKVHRESLCLAVSADRGQSWQRVAYLEAEAQAEFSYPCLIRTERGWIHLVYTWKRQQIKHLAFNLAWLEAQMTGAGRNP